MTNLGKHQNSSLRELFLGHQSHLVADLVRAKAIKHPTLKGDESEGGWRGMLTRHLPRRYRVCTGVVVDSRGGESDAIDVIIHDAHFCPLMLDGRGACFVPAESVYAVFEAKQTLTAPHLRYAGEKVASVRALYRTSAPIQDRGQTKPPRKLSPILGGVLTLDAEWANGLGAACQKTLGALKADQRLDLGCVLSAGAFEVAGRPKRPVIFPAETALVAFFVRLIDRLQKIGTIPAIDWQAYQRHLVTPRD